MLQIPEILLQSFSEQMFQDKWQVIPFDLVFVPDYPVVHLLFKLLNLPRELLLHLG